MLKDTKEIKDTWITKYGRQWLFICALITASIPLISMAYGEYQIRTSIMQKQSEQDKDIKEMRDIEKQRQLEEQNFRDQINSTYKDIGQHLSSIDINVAVVKEQIKQLNHSNSLTLNP